MATFLITYLNGETETVQADYFEPSGGQYVAWKDRLPVALMPESNVRSIVKQVDTGAT